MSISYTHVMHFDHICPILSPNSFQIHLPAPHPFPTSCPVFSWLWQYPLGLTYHGHTLRKTDPLSLPGAIDSLSLSEGWGLLSPSFLHAGLLTSMILPRSYADNRDSCEFLSAVVLPGSGYASFQSSLTSDSLLSLLQLSWSLVGRASDTDIPLCFHELWSCCFGFVFLYKQGAAN